MRRASSHWGPASMRETNLLVGGPLQEFQPVWKYFTLDAIEQIHGHRVHVRGTESVTDCNATEAEPGRHQCLPLRDLKFPPGV